METPLAGLPAYLLSELQAVMNAGARLIFNVDRREDITPFLRQLHWLRVPERITFKIGDTDIPMRQWDRSRIPVIRRATCGRCTRPKTLTLSSIILTSHPS